MLNITEGNYGLKKLSSFTSSKNDPQYKLYEDIAKIIGQSPNQDPVVVSNILQKLLEVNSGLFLKPVTSELSEYVAVENEDGWRPHISRPDIYLGVNQKHIMVGGVITLYDKDQCNARLTPVEFPNLYLAKTVSFSGRKVNGIILDYPVKLFSVYINDEEYAIDASENITATQMVALINEVVSLGHGTRCYSVIWEMCPAHNPEITVKITTSSIEEVEQCINKWASSIKTKQPGENHLVDIDTPEVDESGTVSFPTRTDCVPGWASATPGLKETRLKLATGKHPHEIRTLSPFSGEKLQDRMERILGYDFRSHNNSVFKTIPPTPEHIVKAMDVLKQKIGEIGDNYEVAAMFGMPADDKADYIGVVTRLKR